MSFKLGLVGLCTSHPDSWIPVIREMNKEGVFDVEITAAWDSGETRPAGYAKEYCAKMNIPHAVEKMTDMLPLVDGVMVLTTNWERHMEQAEPFVKAGKAVFIDKPIAGNLKDANQFLDWAKQGYRITGGSAQRFFKPSEDFLAIPEAERGKVYTAYAAMGVDEFNYGIHAYAALCSVLGSGIVSAQYIGHSNQKHIILEWKDGRTGLVTVGKNAWLPCMLTVITDKQIKQLSPGELSHRTIMRKILPYLSGKTDTPPVATAEELIEPELAAMAARISWLNHGQKVYLTDLRLDDPGYDGMQFAREYRRARLEEAKK